jgi:hypothetical protein
MKIEYQKLARLPMAESSLRQNPKQQKIAKGEESPQSIKKGLYPDITRIKP